MYNYIFIDESGNLGIKSTKRYFVVSALKFTSCVELKKSSGIIKKIRQSKLKKKQKKDGEIKFFNSKFEIRKSILEKLNNLNVEVFAVIVDKKKKLF